VLTILTAPGDLYKSQNVASVAWEPIVVPGEQTAALSTVMPIEHPVEPQTTVSATAWTKEDAGATVRAVTPELTQVLGIPMRSGRFFTADNTAASLPVMAVNRAFVNGYLGGRGRSGQKDSLFSKNRDRLLTSDVAQRFFAEVNRQAKKFVSDEHFTVDGTLIQSWASQKNFRSKDGSDDDDGMDFRGQKRSNDTHQSTTDPDARLCKKSYGEESKLSYLGHALVENRNGLIAAAMVTHADGYAERDAALLMLAEKQQGRARRITLGADKAYDSRDFVDTVRELHVTPHITKNDKNRSSNLDRRTTRQPGYAISLSRRWLIEKGFGWLKQTGPLRQVKLRGLEKVDWLFVFSCAAHNLIRLPKLMAQPLIKLGEQCA